MSSVESKKIILCKGMGHKMQVEDLQKTQKNEDFNFHCKMCANPIKNEMYIFVFFCFKAGLRRLLQIRVWLSLVLRQHFCNNQVKIPFQKVVNREELTMF